MPASAPPGRPVRPVAVLGGTPVAALLPSGRKDFSDYPVRAAPGIGDLPGAAGFVCTAPLYAALRRTPATAPTR